MARSNALKGSHLSLAVPGTCYAGMQQIKQGRLNDAMSTFRDALQLATAPGGKEMPAAGFPNIKIGDIFREWNDLESAGLYLERGVEQCRQLGQADVLTDGIVAMARLQLTRGELGQAQETLRQAREVTGRTRIDPFIQCWLADCQLRLWLACDDLDSAIHWGKESGLQPEGELSYHYDLHHLNLARLLLAQARAGDPCLPQARSLLERLLAAAEKAGWVQEQIKAMVLQALVFRLQGDAGQALAALELALRLAEPGGYLRLFLDEGESLQPILGDLRVKLAEDEPRLSGYLARLLGASPSPGGGPLLPKTGPLPARLVEPLTARELEVLRLLATTMTTTEIAASLFVAPSTVHSHIKSLYGKLEVNRRMEALQRARDLGLLPGL